MITHENLLMTQQEVNNSCKKDMCDLYPSILAYTFPFHGFCFAFSSSSFFLRKIKQNRHYTCSAFNNLLSNAYLPQKRQPHTSFWFVFILGLPFPQDDLAVVAHFVSVRPFWHSWQFYAIPVLVQEVGKH